MSMNQNSVNSLSYIYYLTLPMMIQRRVHHGNFLSVLLTLNGFYILNSTIS